MTNDDEMMRLAERCEKAVGPDRRINYDIAAALGKAQFYAGGNPSWHFTALIDAAATLLLRGQDVSLWWGMRGGKPMATAEINGRCQSLAATPALALCAAALRSRISETKKDRDNG
jgi:hypothetical protein